MIVHSLRVIVSSDSVQHIILHRYKHQASAVSKGTCHPVQAWWLAFNTLIGGWKWGYCIAHTDLQIVVLNPPAFLGCRFASLCKACIDFFFLTFILMGVNVCHSVSVCVHTCEAENNLGESVLSSTIWDPETKFRSSGLMASLFPVQPSPA